MTYDQNKTLIAVICVATCTLGITVSYNYRYKGVECQEFTITTFKYLPICILLLKENIYRYINSANS